MQLRLQPSGAQLGHVPSAAVTEVQRLAKHGSQQQQSNPAEIVNTVLSHGPNANGVHADSQQSELPGVDTSSTSPGVASSISAVKSGGPEPDDLPHPLDRSPDDPSLKPSESEFIKAQIQYDWQGHVVDCEAAYHSSTPRRVIDAIGVRPALPATAARNYAHVAIMPSLHDCWAHRPVHLPGIEQLTDHPCNHWPVLPQDAGMNVP